MDPKIEQLTDERDTYEAQRDHYRNLSTSLQSQISLLQSQLSSKFQTSHCAIDPCIFGGESLERLREWRKCLDWLIEERLEKEGREDDEGKKEDGGKAKEERRGRGKGIETELPFSPSNLTGFLTKNHQLTQGRTQYPEPRAKIN
jgi:hypothetical protein